MNHAFYQLRWLEGIVFFVPSPPKLGKLWGRDIKFFRYLAVLFAPESREPRFLPSSMVRGKNFNYQLDLITPGKKQLCAISLKRCLDKPKSRK